jgi:hypothetical protein
MKVLIKKVLNPLESWVEVDMKMYDKYLVEKSMNSTSQPRKSNEDESQWNVITDNM